MLVAVGVMLSVVGPSSAWAGSPIYSYAGQPSTTQAGGHPDINTLFSFGNRDNQEFPTNCLCQDAKNITVRLPTGVVGDPHNVPQCTQKDFDETRGLREVNCSPDTQVGTAFINLFNNDFSQPIYNVEPHPDQAGLLGFFLPLAETPGFIVLSARTGSDYGLDATVTGLEHLIPPQELGVHLWGVPAESGHDSERVPPGPSNAEVRPFLDNPTSCGEELFSSVEIVSYDGGVSTEPDGFPTDGGKWPATTGCDQLAFNPSLYAQPTTTETDSASGLDVDLSVPQLVSPTAPSPSEIRTTTVTLPKGMSINPNAADGKISCSDAEARFGSEEEAECPDLSKIGTLSLTSTALPAPLPGYIYIGEPQPGNRYRIILTADGYDTHVKLAGVIRPDQQTGQLTISFENLPQSPFSDFNLHFFGSERGLLATPAQCGRYPVTSTFTPWDSALSEQTSTQYFTLSEGPGGTDCPGSSRPFNPHLGSGVTDTTAGAHSPFFVNLTRPDGDQTLSKLTVSTPPGFSATLAGIPYCSNASIAAAAASTYSGTVEESSSKCPLASQVGTATTGAGAGNHPVYLSGKVYLAGPYKGAPLSLAVITPAVSGPYDLGNVVVRAALHVNPETAQITAESDPLPQILQGIPLRLRSILIELNRRGFALNPTNCDPFSLEAQIGGDQGAMADLSSHFQVADCTSLPFAPKLGVEALRFDQAQRQPSPQRQPERQVR